MAIVPSLLHNDWYKFTMPPVVQRFYPGTVVGCGFTNRNTDFPVARYIDQGELEDELAALRELRFSKRELDYLDSLGAIPPDYLQKLPNFRMPRVHVERAPNEQYRIECQGFWDEIMPVEVPVLGIVTELASRALAKEAGLSPLDLRRNAHKHWDELIAFLKANPEVKIAPFGARRHYSAAIEYEGTARLVEAVPDQIAGISNVALAREFGYPVSGTIAHEYFIVPTMIHIARGTPNPIGVAQNEAMDAWEAVFKDIWGGAILCAIPDTFGTDSFLEHFSYKRALDWRVFKQDSGDPKVFVDKVIRWLLDSGLNPKMFRINHTDGLNIPIIDDLRQYCPEQYQHGYGMGTHHSNNVGVPTHSFVWKPAYVMVDGKRVGAAKLTDNVAKATGDPAMIETLKQLTHYHTTFNQLQTV